MSRTKFIAARSNINRVSDIISRFPAVRKKPRENNLSIAIRLLKYRISAQRSIGVFYCGASEPTRFNNGNLDDSLSIKKKKNFNRLRFRPTTIKWFGPWGAYSKIEIYGRIKKCLLNRFTERDEQIFAALVSEFVQLAHRVLAQGQRPNRSVHGAMTADRSDGEKKKSSQLG